ncbi:MAG: 50S ribosomal protein L25/general stress protein Ctc [Proteobacteria bacterium]|jgi:large subunit ribosomal protein L25|nr:50S ribosomal protein L25/general stress protein Ctc [Pseudomonadota bacterium]
MSNNFVVEAEHREGNGTADSRRARHANKVPAVIYGAGKENGNLLLDHDALMHKLEVEAFTSAILEIKTDKGTDQAIVRDVQYHPYKPRILHVDFQRVSATEKLSTSVPVHMTGLDVAPGVAVGKGIASTLIADIDITCLPANLPEYLEADMSALEIGESIHLSELKLPEGVEIASLNSGGDDLAVAAILAPKRQGEGLAAAAEAEAGDDVDVADVEVDADAEAAEAEAGDDVLASDGGEPSGEG